MRPSPQMAIAFSALVVFLLAGCGGSGSGSGSDKAGGGRTPTTVLTLANSLGETNELQAFADEVATRSKGTLRIRFRNEWRQGEIGYEPALIRDVAAGRADIGWVGSRALDALGIHAFDALTAPFLVDRYALERDVLASDVSHAMLPSLEPLGVTGLGILPGPLRYQLAADHALLRPADYEGVRVGYQRGPARDTLRALGAKPVAIPSGAEWRGIDAVEQQIASINLRGYDQEAKHLTANVPLWPRPFVVFASSKTMATLSEAQRALLRDALRASIPAALDIARAQERDGMAALCRRGIDAVEASAEDVAALAVAVAPVLDRLRRDPATRAAMEVIAGMRARTAAEPALGCVARKRPSARALPDGTYTTDPTLADILASGVQNELDEAGIRNFDQSTFSLVVHGGTFVVYGHHPDGQREVTYEGEFSVYRDRIVATGNNHDVVRARFSVDGTSVKFRDVSPRGFYSALFGSEPWKRSP